MKNIFIALILGVTVAVTPVFATQAYKIYKNEYKIVIDDKETNIDAYNIDDHTYLKLRDFAKYLNFDVLFEDETVYVNTEDDKLQNPQAKKYKTFSILGDSYSTYEGFVEPAENWLWYPSPENTPNDVKNIEDTWMKLFIKEYGAKLEINNSFSGSPVCYDGYGDGNTDSKDYSFVKRVENVGNPELIIVEGATNDDWAGAEIGEYKYENWTEEDLTTFRPALAYVFDYLKKNNSESDVIFMLNNALSTEITESVETICKHYDIKLLKLDNISKRSDHPNKQGMIEIKNQLIEFLNK